MTDIETTRAQVPAIDFVRGTPSDVAESHIDHEDSHHNHVIEKMVPTANEDAFFEMMLNEGVPPTTMTAPAWSLICSARKSWFLKR